MTVQWCSAVRRPPGSARRAPRRGPPRRRVRYQRAPAEGPARARSPRCPPLGSRAARAARTPGPRDPASRGSRRSAARAESRDRLQPGAAPEGRPPPPISRRGSDPHRPAQRHGPVAPRPGGPPRRTTLAAPRSNDRLGPRPTTSTEDDGALLLRCSNETGQPARVPAVTGEISLELERQQRRRAEQRIDQRAQGRRRVGSAQLLRPHAHALGRRAGQRNEPELAYPVGAYLCPRERCRAVGVGPPRPSSRAGRRASVPAPCRRPRGCLPSQPDRLLARAPRSGRPRPHPGSRAAAPIDRRPRRPAARSPGPP